MSSQNVTKAKMSLSASCMNHVEVTGMFFTGETSFYAAAVAAAEAVDP